MHKLNEILNRIPAWERRFARKYQLIAVARMNELAANSSYSQTEIAERAGWSKSFVSRLLSGEGNVTLKTVARFEEAVGADVLAVTEEQSAWRSLDWVRPTSGSPLASPGAVRSVVGTSSRIVPASVYTN